MAHLPFGSVDSSLIFLVIIGMWAAFLVPYWLRRRVHLSGSRASDRHSSAMRVLPPRVDVAARPVRGTGSAANALLTRAAPPAPARPEAPRRTTSRRLPVTGLLVLGLLAALLAAVVVVPLLVYLGYLQPWATAVPVGGLAVLVTALRTRVRRRARRRRATARASRRTAPRGAAPRNATVRRPRPAPAPVSEERPGSWTPVPVPPPTYTLKPEAPRRQVLPEPVPAPQPAARREAPATVPDVPDLDAVLERRRAVNL